MTKKSLKDKYRCVYAYYDKSHKVSLPQLATFAVGEDVRVAMAHVMEYADVSTLCLFRHCELRPVGFFNTVTLNMTKPSTEMVMIDLSVIADEIIKKVSE